MMTAYDVDAVRREFPVTEHMLYLDSAFQTPLARSVRERLMSFYDEAHYNAGPKSVWLERLAGVRAKIAELLGADSSEIAFTKNTSEGLNIAAHALRYDPGDNVLLVEGEHPNNTCAWLGRRKAGLEVRLIPESRKWVDAETFKRFVDARTRAISISHVMFHSGQRNDLERLASFCRERDIKLIVDGMQSIGVLPVDVKKLGIAMFAAGAHKGLLAPQGIGILYCDKELAANLEPEYYALSSLANPPADLVVGPGPFEFADGARRFELGNYNHAGVHALDASIDLIRSAGVPAIAEHVLDLGDRLIGHLDALGIGLVGPRERRYRSHIYVLALDSGVWLQHLAQHNVRASQVRNGIRISFAMFNTVQDVDRLADILSQGHASRSVNRAG
ncbi:MAG TPA: aminotransferase class V-fold PLP-dependent enzyme [Candidatus Baltobacteraceae bacterium]|jgi:selenocysteine lyase/cysteine desulfurase